MPDDGKVTVTLRFSKENEHKLRLLSREACEDMSTVVQRLLDTIADPPEPDGVATGRQDAPAETAEGAGEMRADLGGTANLTVE